MTLSSPGGLQGRRVAVRENETSVGKETETTADRKEGKKGENRKRMKEKKFKLLKERVEQGRTGVKSVGS